MEATINKKINNGRVIEVINAAKDLYYIKISVNNFKVKAGQFVSVLCGNLTLRRPFSVMNYENNIMTILFKLKGKGTEYIKNLKEGDVIDFTGPFGNGFNIENKKALLVAAGVGVAPIYFLKQTLNTKNINNQMICGFLNKENIPDNIEIDKITTDDGSFGIKGSVINLIEEEILKYSPEKIYACGPEIVLKLTSQIAEKHSIPCEVAMEKEMACSIGVCRGCVIKLRNGQNATVCKDGPVFMGEDILWN